MHARICFVTLIYCIGLALSLQAQQPVVPTVKLALKPAAAPVPLIRFELLPNFREQVPGNAALAYHRAILLLGMKKRESASAKEQFDTDIKIDDMIAKPAHEIDRRALSEYLQGYNSIFREVEAGAKCNQCDWGLDHAIDAEGIGVLLPEIQKMRELGRLLSARCTLHCVEGKLNEAFRDVQSGFAMAHHVGKGPTMIQMLVGVALFHMFEARLEQILVMPDCPNLYWSLTALP